MSDWAELRALLAVPSKDNWDALLSLARSCEETEWDAFLAYALPHLEAWSDDLRQATKVVLSDEEGMRLLPLIKVLNLSRAFLGDDGLITLLDTGALHHLSGLNLRWNSIGNRGAEALFASTSFTQLRRLVLSGNQIGPEGLRAFVEKGQFPVLEELYLADNQLGEGGISLLMGVTHPQLQTVFVANNLEDEVSMIFGTTRLIKDEGRWLVA